MIEHIHNVIKMDTDRIDKLSDSMNRYKKTVDAFTASIKKIKEDYKSGSIVDPNEVLEKLKEASDVFKNIPKEKIDDK